MTYEIHGFPAGLARADGAVSAGGREPARATVDLDAIRRNVEVLREHAGSAEVMAVVKADGYGHGLVPSARAASATSDRHHSADTDRSTSAAMAPSKSCLLYTSPSPRDGLLSRMPSSA